MEALATDRIFRLMIAQRLRYPGTYTPASLSAMFDDELDRILSELRARVPDETAKRYRRARALGANDPHRRIRPHVSRAASKDRSSRQGRRPSRRG
jgi:hypothetical protein